MRFKVDINHITHKHSCFTCARFTNHEVFWGFNDVLLSCVVDATNSFCTTSVLVLSQAIAIILIVVISLTCVCAGLGYYARRQQGV